MLMSCGGVSAIKLLRDERDAVPGELSQKDGTESLSRVVSSLGDVI